MASAALMEVRLVPAAAENFGHICDWNECDTPEAPRRMAGPRETHVCAFASHRRQPNQPGEFHCAQDWP